jgi:glutamine amidotransferase
MEDSLKIVIIDYEMGNVKSISNAFRHICPHEIIVSSNFSEIEKSDALILPGVGAFSVAMEHLRQRDLIRVLNDEVLGKRKPILGICLGMQLLLQQSEEGGLFEGLGWIEGKVERIDSYPGHRIPHIGWNEISTSSDCFLFEGVAGDRNFYFVHSYYANCPEQFIAATFEYGKNYTAAVQRGNIIGTQFHPEKSQKNGFTLLRNFIRHIEGGGKC